MRYSIALVFHINIDLCLFILEINEFFQVFSWFPLGKPINEWSVDIIKNKWCLLGTVTVIKSGLYRSAVRQEQGYSSSQRDCSHCTYPGLDLTFSIKQTNVFLNFLLASQFGPGNAKMKKTAAKYLPFICCSAKSEYCKNTENLFRYLTFQRHTPRNTIHWFIKQHRNSIQIIIWKRP